MKLQSRHYFQAVERRRGSHYRSKILQYRIYKWLRNQEGLARHSRRPVEGDFQQRRSHLWWPEHR